MLQDVEDGEELFASSDGEVVGFEKIADAERDEDVAHAFHCQIEVGLELAFFDLLSCESISRQFWDFDFYDVVSLLADS